MNLELLKNPFDEKDIEWRIGRAGETVKRGRHVWHI